MPRYSLQQILDLQVAWDNETFRPLAYFQAYLQHGYYPFLREHDFTTLIMQIINLSLETDIPQFAGISVATGRRLKHLLSIISKSVPFKPNMSGIA